jgi:hypothetical protein
VRENIFIRVFKFYFLGFKNMPRWGRYLWLIILLKIFFMFAVLKVFFMPDLLEKKFQSDQERGEYVLDQLAK